jgi:hypothetical protein
VAKGEAEIRIYGPTEPPSTRAGSRRIEHEDRQESEEEARQDHQCPEDGQPIDHAGPEAPDEGGGALGWVINRTLARHASARSKNRFASW